MCEMGVSEGDCNQCPNMDVVNIIVANTNGYLLHVLFKLPIKQLEFK